MISVFLDFSRIKILKFWSSFTFLSTVYKMLYSLKIINFVYNWWMSKSKLKPKNNQIKIKTQEIKYE